MRRTCYVDQKYSATEPAPFLTLPPRDFDDCLPRDADLNRERRKDLQQIAKFADRTFERSGLPQLIGLLVDLVDKRISDGPQGQGPSSAAARPLRR
jgi:hypothetical protein